MIIYTIAFILITFICGLLYVSEKHKFAKNIPALNAIPFFGVLFEIYGLDPKGAYKASKKLLWHEEKIVKLCATPFIMYLSITDPEYLRKLLNNPNALNKGFIYKFLELKRSLLTADAERWHPLRRYFNKAFTLSNLKTFVGIFDKNSRALADRIEKYAGSGDFDLMDHVLLTALINVCETSVGIKFETEEMNMLIVKAFHQFHNYVINQMFELHHWFSFISPLFPLYWKKKSVDQLINRHLMELVKKKQNMRSKAVDNNNTDDDYEKSIYRDAKIYIDQILELNRTENMNFNNEDVVADTNLLISGSLATNSNFLCHAIIYLAIHQDVQDRVYQEISKIFPNPDESVTFDRLTDLVYLDMVAKETLRLAPSLGHMIHKTSGDVELDEGLVIPKNTTIIVSITGVHRLKHIWGDDADEFNPDRFLPDEVEKRHPYSFIPFSAGPRNCIGYKYGMLSVKTMLVHLLRRYQFTTPYKMNDLEFETNIYVSLSKPYLVSIERRQ